MSLKVYEEALPTTSFSTDGDMSNPIRHSFDGRLGGVIEKRYYLHNDDPLLYYSGITLTPLDTGPDHLVDGTNGFSWKLKAGDQQPVAQEWATIDDGNAISFTAIGNSIQGDVTTYLPFWLRIEVPKGADIDSFDDITLRLTASGITV